MNTGWPRLLANRGPRSGQEVVITTACDQSIVSCAFGTLIANQSGPPRDQTPVLLCEMNTGWPRLLANRGPQSGWAAITMIPNPLLWTAISLGSLLFLSVAA